MSGRNTGKFIILDKLNLEEKMKTGREKASYCIGLETGRHLREQFKEMDSQLLVQGVQDGFSATEPKLTLDEIKSVLEAVRQQVETQQKQFVAKISHDNKKKSEDFLESNKKKEGVKTLTSGLQYAVLKSGAGDTPTLLDTVSVHYRGYFMDGREFDSSYARDKPVSFPVNRVIPGWAEALQLMKVGDKWRIFIPPYLAYGEMGFGAEIEPNVALIFEMELLGIN